MHPCSIVVLLGIHSRVEAALNMGPDLIMDFAQKQRRSFTDHSDQPKPQHQCSSLDGPFCNAITKITDEQQVLIDMITKPLPFIVLDHPRKSRTGNSMLNQILHAFSVYYQAWASFGCMSHGSRIRFLAAHSCGVVMFFSGYWATRAVSGLCHRWMCS